METILGNTTGRPLSQSVFDELLRQLADTARSGQVVGMLRETNVLQWLSNSPAFTSFVHACAGRGHAEVLERAALACPGCLDLRDDRGRTALHFAARRGHLVTLNRLLDWGANPRAACSKGNTALHVVAKRRYVIKRSRRYLSALIQKAAAAAAYIHSHSPSISISISLPSFGRTSSQEAIRVPPASAQSAAASEPQQPTSGRTPTPDAFVPGDASPDSDDDDDYDERHSQPLSWSASSASLPAAPPASAAVASSSAVAAAAAPKDADPGALANAVPKIEELIAFTVKRLCKTNDPNAINAEGYTPLRLAVDSGNDIVAKVLRECGAELGDDMTQYDSIVEVVAETAPPTSLSSSAGSLPAPNAPAPTVGTPRQRSMAMLASAGAGIARVATKVQHSVAESSQTMVAAVKRLNKNARSEYIMRVREIIDERPRKLLARPTGPPGQPKYRMLSMDGGGIRCIMHPIILARLIKRFPNFLESIDMFCACSGAAPISILFLSGFSCEAISKFLELSAEKTLRKTQGNGITGVKYTTRWLRLMCDIVMGDKRLKDLPRHVVIPAYKLDNGVGQQKRKGEVIFMNNVSPGSGEDRAVDACLRSGAAPTYFRCYQGHVDGGVFANNPSACSFPLVLGSRPQGLGLPPDNVVCLSLGTGYAHKQYVEDSKVIDGGLYQWGVKLLDVFNSAQLDFCDVLGQNFLGPRYWRHMPPLPGQISLDEVKSFPILRRIAETIPLDDLFAWVEQYWL